MSDLRTVHIIVEGKVQGVFYRATTKEVAEKIGLKGWVKNKEDGSVEITATGSEEQVQELIEWCERGPSRAEVSNLHVTDLHPQIFDRFEVVRK